MSVILLANADRFDPSKLVRSVANANYFLWDIPSDPESPLLLGFVVWAMDGLARVYSSQSLHRAAVVEKHPRQFWEGLDFRVIEKGMPASALHDAYLAWHQNERIMGRPLQIRNFAAACRAARLVEYRTGSGKMWQRPPEPLSLVP